MRTLNKSNFSVVHTSKRPQKLCLKCSQLKWNQVLQVRASNIFGAILMEGTSCKICVSPFFPSNKLANNRQNIEVFSLLQNLSAIGITQVWFSHWKSLRLLRTFARKFSSRWFFFFNFHCSQITSYLCEKYKKDQRTARKIEFGGAFYKKIQTSNRYFCFSFFHTRRKSVEKMIQSKEKKGSPNVQDR